MNTFTDFYRYNRKCQDKLKKIIEPLKAHYGIDTFWHATVEENGFFSNVCNFYEQWEVFWENQCHKNTDHLIAPSHLKSGYFHLEFDANFKKVQEVVQNSHPLNHPFINIRKESKTKAHIFGFATSMDIPTLPSFYINNLSILNSFIDYYIDSNVNDKNVPRENMLNIAELRGQNNFYGKSYGIKCLPTPKQNCLFLKHIGIKPELLSRAEKLTIREKEVLAACLKGKTAAETGNALKLSPRTVQSYVENVKNRLGILSRDELIKEGRVLKMAGLLDGF